MHELRLHLIQLFGVYQTLCPIEREIRVDGTLKLNISNLLDHCRTGSTTGIQPIWGGWPRWSLRKRARKWRQDWLLPECESVDPAECQQHAIELDLWDRELYRARRLCESGLWINSLFHNRNQMPFRISRLLPKQKQSQAPALSHPPPTIFNSPSPTARTVRIPQESTQSCTRKTKAISRLLPKQNNHKHLQSHPPPTIFNSVPRLILIKSSRFRPTLPVTNCSMAWRITPEKYSLIIVLDTTMTQRRRSRLLQLRRCFTLFGSPMFWDIFNSNLPLIRGIYGGMKKLSLISETLLRQWIQKKPIALLLTTICFRMRLLLLTQPIFPK